MGLTFTNKAGISLSSVILGFMLESSGYVEGSIAQSPQAIHSLFIASVIIPLVSMLIIMLLLNFPIFKNYKPEQISFSEIN